MRHRHDFKRHGVELVPGKGDGGGLVGVGGKEGEGAKDEL